ncbi:MAG: hypothetical protein JRD93_05330 [Deltaproteobacteria bacterium]|nr:hypothetical protein [Deltaproteobacteria bacterium]
MKKGFYCGLVLMICSFILGMGNMGEDDVVNMPEPEQNYSVTLVDQSDVSIDLEKFSCNGMIYFIGNLGKTEVSVGYDRIDSVFFLLHDEDVKAKLHLKNGKVIELVVDRNKSCYGVSSFGNCRIEMQDIKNIVIHGKILKKVE